MVISLLTQKKMLISLKKIKFKRSFTIMSLKNAIYLELLSVMKTLTVQE